MQEKPLDSILGREEARKQVTEHYGDQIKLLNDLTNYGSNLIRRAFDSSNKEWHDVVVCGALLKQVVAMLDVIETLVKEGIVQAAFSPFRTLLEASIYLKWILLGDSDRKAKCYIVSNLREERLWVSRSIDGTQERAAFSSMFKSKYEKQPAPASRAKKDLEGINKILTHEDFQAINDEFDKGQSKKKIDPKWYKLAGGESIWQIAKEVNYLPEYELFYTMGSQVIHSTSYEHHININFSKEEVFFNPIRSLQYINYLIDGVFMCTCYAFQEVIQHYLQEELPAFSKKYAEDWLTPFMSIPSIKIERSSS